jgi:hypothetical protein
LRVAIAITTVNFASLGSGAGRGPLSRGRRLATCQAAPAVAGISRKVGHGYQRRDNDVVGRQQLGQEAVLELARRDLHVDRLVRPQVGDAPSSHKFSQGEATSILTLGGLDRCLRRQGVSHLQALMPQPGDDEQPQQTFKDYEPGFVHVDVK